MVMPATNRAAASGTPARTTARDTDMERFPSGFEESSRRLLRSTLVMSGAGEIHGITTA
jgi:hypothetical protein